ncbi:MAG TPA: PKD domain-containing protein [Anaeromyxobacter sp.]|nr:PKD domain-containing protein [Anaeromyxobacter sp.]
MSRATPTPSRCRLAPPARAARLLLLACACEAMGPPPGHESAPAVAGTVDRDVGPTPLRACFAATASGDASALALSWDFGDGSPRAAAAAVCHVYAEPGSYAASVAVSDGAARSAMAVVVVTAAAP